jgi:hypothetical protein
VSDRSVDKRLRIEREDPRDVERDIAIPNHNDPPP